MDLEGITLSGLSHMEKDKKHDFTHGIENKKVTNEHTKPK